MDEVIRYNKERWEALAEANVLYSRPMLDLDVNKARQVVDAEGMLGSLKGKDVLCLASGGGQQSVAFALLGANVTVFDLSETQLRRDSETAMHYDLKITTVQGDMSNLSPFPDNSFDVVWHAYSLNFVPDPLPVFREVARVLREGGLYRMMCANPFIIGIDERDWNGAGYPLRHPYVDGEVMFEDEHWEFVDAEGNQQRIKGPVEFRHTLHTLLHGLADTGFVLLGAWEELSEEPHLTPGGWEHFKSVAPPWLTFWNIYRPEAFHGASQSST